jgi:hypothetical protein
MIMKKVSDGKKYAVYGGGCGERWGRRKIVGWAAPTGTTAMPRQFAADVVL